jgi:hypothetical protein
MEGRSVLCRSRPLRGLARGTVRRAYRCFGRMGQPVREAHLGAHHEHLREQSSECLEWAQ